MTASWTYVCNICRAKKVITGVDEPPKGWSQDVQGRWRCAKHGEREHG